MSGQHTPGEWMVFTSEDEWGCDTFVGTLTDTLFDVRPWKGPSWQEANARLISAAPELLAALKCLSQTMAGMLVAGDVIRNLSALGLDSLWGEVNTARAAIAKATGETK
jgi:hypothetical protein